MTGGRCHQCCMRCYRYTVEESEVWIVAAQERQSLEQGHRAHEPQLAENAGLQACKIYVYRINACITSFLQPKR